MTYTRTIHFKDTDAAGVVYFANILSICHEAYEAALAARGICLQSFFRNPTTAIPIVHATVDFFRPMFCGDLVRVKLTPNKLNNSEFELAYEIVSTEEQTHRLAQALTRHVCIETASRRRQNLPDEIVQWLHNTG